MSTQKEPKIRKLLEQHTPGTVCLATWLESIGISRDLQKRYRKSGWLESVGTGAFKRPGDTVQWQGGLYALQTQAHLPVHAGAFTALSRRGLLHYARVAKETVFLFSPPKTTLPKWFKDYNWDSLVHHVKTSMLSETLGLTKHEEKTFTITISSPERAILECLYLTPNTLDLVECYHVLEGLTNLRPKMMQELLEACTSIKVKRLFLYMAEKAGHQWLSFIDRSKVSLGSGHRNLVKGGVHVAPFQINVPTELAAL
jgi:hypothetical protein